MSQFDFMEKLLDERVPTREHGNQSEQALPDTLETNLPSIEQLERELQGEGL